MEKKKNESAFALPLSPHFFAVANFSVNVFLKHDLKNRKHKQSIKAGAISQICVHNNAN